MPAFVVALGLVAVVGLLLWLQSSRRFRVNRPTVSAPALREIADDATLRAVLASDRAVIYKHSTRCAVSAIVIDEVRQFAKRHPGWPVHMIRVIEHRTLSNRVADQLDIRHESPQAIVLKEGRCLWHASHTGITARELSRHLT